MASELTEAQLINKVDALNTIIDNAMSATGIAAFDYKIGDIEVKKGTAIGPLITQRDYYLKELRLVQCAGADLMTSPDYEVSPFGEILGEEVDED